MCPTFCDPMDCSLPLHCRLHSVHGILQARILEWVARLSSGDSSWPRDRTCVSYVSWNWQASSLPLTPPGKSYHNRGYIIMYIHQCLHITCFCCLITKSRHILCSPMDGGSPPGTSVHGTSQAKILEWVAISFSRASF